MHLTNKFDQAIIQIRFYFQCMEIIIIIKKFIIHEKYENIKKIIKIVTKISRIIQFRNREFLSIYT